MLCSDDSGSSKNACFAISCLAASPEGHEKLLDNTMCDRVLNTLATLLSDQDFETGWFAAMWVSSYIVNIFVVSPVIICFFGPSCSIDNVYFEFTLKMSYIGTGAAEYPT